MQNFCKLENAKKLKKFGEKNSKLKNVKYFFCQNASKRQNTASTPKCFVKCEIFAEMLNNFFIN